MKVKYLFAWVLTFTLCLTMVTSCSKDDNNESYDTKLVGKWQLYEGIGDYFNYEDCDFEGWIDIKNDGNFSEYDKCEDYTMTGKWSTESNILIINYYSVPLNYQIVSITDNELILEATLFGKSIHKYKRLN